MSRGSFGSFEEGGGYSSYHSGGPPVAGRDGANEYTRLSQVVGNNVQKINGNVQQIQRLVGQVGTPADNPDLRDKLHQVTHYTNQLAKDTSSYLKDLSHLPAPSNQSDQRQRKMQKERLMNEFTSSLNKFQAAQRQAAEKEKASMARARAHSDRLSDPFADEKKRDTPYFDSPPPQKQQQVFQMEENVDLQLMQEREQALHKLESDIMDVNEIFKDLGVLVHEQGEVIDSIEANVESAQIHVEEGKGQLQQAEKYQNKARRKKVIIIVIVVVVLSIIAIILGVTLSKN